MIADDEKAVHRVLERILKDCPYRLQSAYSAQEVLETARSNRPDIIMLDVNMPGKNGLEVLHDLRHDPMTQDIRVILMSGYPGFSDQVDSVSGTIDDFIHKPFESQELKARLRKAMRRSVQDISAMLPSRLMKLEEPRTCPLEQRPEVPAQQRDAARTPAKSGHGRWAQAAFAFLAGVACISCGLSLLRKAPSIEQSHVRAEAPVAAAAPAVEPAAAPALALPPVPAGPALEAIRVQRFRVTLSVSGPVSMRVIPRIKPAALILELAGVRSGLASGEISGKGSMIRGVRVRQLNARAQRGVRVLVDVARPVNYKVKNVDGRIVVDFYYDGRELGNQAQQAYERRSKR